MSGGSIVVAGGLAQRPRRGGHAWVFLQYLLGFRRLGWDVFFVDRLDGTDVNSGDSLTYLHRVLNGFGLGESWAVLQGDDTIGCSRAALVDRLRRSELLLNVMGVLDDEELLAVAPRRVFLDIDPGYGQFWRHLGLADLFRNHDYYVTIGANVGTPACSIPACGLDWIGTRPPVVLSEWPQVPPTRDVFTSIATWRGPYGTLESDGETFGSRVHEFRRFFAMPLHSTAAFELALDIDKRETTDLAALRENGWHLVDPLNVAGDPAAYRTYLQTSAAEFMVAQSVYVRTASGWFSDRSACYLASGKPVLAQDTGLRSLYSVGEGLVVFSSFEEAVVGAEYIRADYARHARTARELAVEYFASDKVLGLLLDQVGSSTSSSRPMTGDGQMRPAQP